MLTFETLPHQIQSPVKSTRSWWPSPTSRAGRSGSGSPAPSSSSTSCTTGSRCATTCWPATSTWTPLPGYRFANWETGYGDLNAVIDPRHGPAPSLAARERAGPLRPADHGRRTGRGVAPPHPAAARSSGPPGTASRSSARPSSSSTSSASPSPKPPASGWHDARPPRRHHRGLPAAPDVARGVHHRAHPQPDARSRHPHRVLQGGGRHRGQHEINITYGEALEVADRHWCSRTG